MRWSASSAKASGASRAAVVVSALLLVGQADVARAEDLRPCVPLSQGPDATYTDYNDPAGAETVRLVERHHFTPQVENLVRGQSGSVPADIAFVLRAVPNHYRALVAMGRWQIRNGLPAGSGEIYSADCYFKRAISFRGNDASLHLAYAVYLHQAKRYEEAEREYLRTEELGGGSAELYYNHGLLAVDRGRIAEARQYAEKAYAMGYPLPGLRNRLRDFPAGSD